MFKTKKLTISKIELYNSIYSYQRNTKKSENKNEVPKNWLIQQT